MPYRDPPAQETSTPVPFRAPRSARTTAKLRLLLLLPLPPVLYLLTRTFDYGEELPWDWLLSWTVVVLAWWFWARMKFQRGLRALLESQALLNAGSYQAGGDCCRQILDSYRGNGAIEAPALSNLSIAVYHQGDVARALEMVDAVERSGWCGRGSALRTVVLQNRALYLAVLGKLPEAERAAHEARSAMSGARAAATMLVHDTVLAARAGRFSDVVAVTGTSDAMSKLQLRLPRLLRAWALTTTGGDREEVRVLLDGAKPIGRGELNYVAKHWPEFRAFLVDNGFADAAHG
jgi:hypothetical protein